MSRTVVVCLLLIVVLAPSAIAKDPPKPPNIEETKKTFVEEGPFADRRKAGVKLAFWAPDVLAEVLDEMVAAQKEVDLKVISKVAVQTKCRHVRLLLGYAVSRYEEGAVASLLDKIDNDHPYETVRAIGLLGFLRDAEAWPRLLELIRHEDDRIGVMAARAMARIGTVKHVKELVEVAVTVDQIHVRTHIAWAVQDMVGSRKKAISSFGKLQGRPGAVGSRAKEMMGVLLDEISQAQKYKEKLEIVRGFFTPKRGVKLPKLKAPKEHRETLERVITGMKEKVPAYYHLICTVVNTIEVSSGDWRFDHKRGAVNIRYADILKWDRDELFEYYLVRYAAIICLGKLGDPTLGHRGWEEGMIDGWWYAMDHTLIALPESLKGYVKSFLRAPPW